MNTDIFIRRRFVYAILIHCYNVLLILNVKKIFLKVFQLKCDEIGFFKLLYKVIFYIYI